MVEPQSSTRWRLDKRWMVHELGGGRCRLVWDPVRQSLDSHVRKWARVSSRGGLYVVESRTLAEDIQIAVRIAQQRWSYEGYQRRKRVKSRLEAGITSRLFQGRRLSLVTLPFPGADSGELWAAFRLLVRRLRHEQGKVEFCGVRAIGSRTGVLHAHVVMDMGYLKGGQRWLSEQWEILTGCRVVDIREVKSAGVVGYVARQVTGYVSDQGTGRILISKGWLEYVGKDSFEDAESRTERSAKTAEAGAAHEDRSTAVA